ncbi:SDR family oxidoreductase [Pseudonocardia kujensis]|uniref:SDR family NAD(P)-dependent oxidoreductase n=1 Tax=Pseudonocardia kujensis TaxID=1128675 RepID=UPI001E2A436D|nr:SDR family oxidoreductase [Pseudonocardia kujensis]MCE0763518.1 SDR family oxidoreductase [Pseudonocardia kujensis]
MTGGARGIGLAVVERLRAEGAEVHVADLLSCSPLDVTDAAAVAEFVDSLPTCPYLAVNAVGNANLQLILEQDVEQFRRILDIELAGAYNVLQAAARRMVSESVAGCIVNISSENEEYPSRGLSGHCAAKAGLAMLTKVAAVELGVHGIRVNAVAPGCTATPLTAAFTEVPSYVEGVRVTTPLGGRMGEPAEIAAAVAFLGSEDARWITGRSLRVDGGQSLVYVPDPLDAVAAAGETFSSQVVNG